jgi:hypothetical protein
MVLISPPEGWIPEEEPPAHAVTPPTPLPVTPPLPFSAVKESAPRAKNGDSSIHRGAPPEAEATVDEKPVVEPPPVQLPVSLSAEIAATLAPPVAAAPPAAEATSVPATAMASLPAGFTPFELPEVVAGQTFLSLLTRSLWGRVTVLMVSGLLGLAAVLAVWTVVSKRHVDPKPDAQVAASETADPPPASPTPFNRRWLPEQTVLLVDLRMSRLVLQPSALDAMAFLDTWRRHSDQGWQQACHSLLSDLHVRQEDVRRMTWASTDLADCVARGVVVLQLDENIDLGRQLPAGESIDLGANFVARRPHGGFWPHPLLAVDAHTIVTGSEDTLRQLVARRGEAKLSSKSIEQLLAKFSPDCNLTVMVDLLPARTAVWSFPPNLLDVWPAGKASWRALCEAPLTGLGISAQAAGAGRCELALVCNSDGLAGKVHTDIEKLAPAAIQALPAHIAAVQGILPVKLSGAVAARYKRLLGELLAALGSARCDVADGAVWLRFDWGGSGFLAWGAATIDNDNAAAIKADWLAAALAVDEGNQRGLLGGLLRWVKAQNPPRFPEGADGAVTFKPQTRLSWIAGILPYLGHGDWHVESGYDWNNTLNQATVRRPLPEVVNPALGPAVSSDGYPATHYVGVAGVGKDAAELPADDPRAGMFGYGRQTRQQDFKRGGSNTIAILGVQDHCGPWAQGGLATVRPLTQEPYVNGPDGFGSGQADGMVAGMADGSVRFLSKDISPRVMEQLASVRRGDEVDPAALESKRPEAVKKDPPVPDRKPSLADLHPPAKELKTKEEPSPALRAKLDVPIAKISLAKMPLGEAVQIVATIGNLPVSFDPDAMQELGVSLHDVISLDETAKTTAGKALEAIAASRGMTTLLENGQIVLTSPAEHREILRQIRYTLSDLTGGDAKAAADLAALVQALVAPESWRSGGGQGALEATPDALLITQTGRVHYQVIVFCEKLRIARGLLPKSRLDRKKFVLITRATQARAILNHTASVTANLPVSLAGVLEQFKQPPGTEILIDRPALAADEISENMSEKVKLDKLPQGEALRQLLEPLGLAWRVVDANTLQVTTPKVLAARMELEFYPVAKLLSDQSPAALIEKIKEKLGEAKWDEGDGAGRIRFDPPSRCLIVLQSQPVQMALESLLGRP